MFVSSILTAFSLFLFVLLIFYTFSSDWVTLKVYSKKTKTSILFNYGLLLGKPKFEGRLYTFSYINVVNLNMFFIVRKSKENIHLFRKIVL